MPTTRPEPDEDLEALLEFLKTARGFDFTGYKRTTLRRRIAKRLQAVSAPDLASYVDYLEVHPEEFGRLFDTILINVTGFFRDPEAWAFLSAEVLPRILAQRPPGAPIRVWTAGCATGAEAYSVAMSFAELMGLDEFRERVKIYATDADDHALGEARQASYSEREMEGVPPALREKYFQQADGRSVFRKDLRRLVIFGRHDLVQDAPISRVDLLTCRNTLMYFNSETQERILARLHFALADGGFLFLGRAETMMTQPSLFVPVDLKRRVFAKVSGALARDRAAPAIVTAIPGREATPARVLREAAFDAGPAAQLVVDAAGTLVTVNERARSLFGIAQADVGRALQDLRISYRPVELRSLIEQATTDRRPTVAHDVEWHSNVGETRWLDVLVVPIQSGEDAPAGVSITFTDVTLAKRLQHDLERSNHELESAYEELQSTNEELETTNEELQSTVEELETTNEEIQSANEELETMNEELQSTNEELQATNEQLRIRSDELNGVNAFLESILRSIEAGVAVLDRDMRVLLWSRRAEELWGLRQEEVAGQEFLSLDIGLPLETVREPILDVLAARAGSRELTVRAINRRGRAIDCRVSCIPLSGEGAQRGVIVFMEQRRADSPQRASGNGHGDGDRAEPGEA